jgi:predicted ArsR family transcriptional regulator
VFSLIEIDFDTQVTGIATLRDPTRRALYRFVMSHVQPVSREEAAAGIGVAPHVAKFHLDKMLDDGLLAVEYARAPGRCGPGAGRPAKRYSRSARELSVSLPQRDYALAGRLLARAVSAAAHDDVPIDEALTQVSRATGRALGREARDTAGDQPDPAALVAAASLVLHRCGYEPHSLGIEVIMINCPFHALAQEFTDLVCGMNLDVMRGLTDALQHPSLEARLEPATGRCCVLLTEQPTVHHLVVDKEE